MGDMSDSKQPGLDDAYALSGAEDARRLYADWAETYDSDFAEANAYRPPEVVARLFAEAGGTGPVLDAGAGTGLGGLALAARGIGPLDALDLSPEMLSVAARKGVYRELIEGDILAGLAIADGAYAGVVSAGTFTLGHVGPEGFDELLRVAAPGALLVISVNARAYESDGFAAKMETLAPAIEGLAMAEEPIYGPGATGPHAGDMARVLSFRKRAA
jgi:predicted TPR repeat methyltransferase